MMPTHVRMYIANILEWIMSEMALLQVVRLYDLGIPP
jgi:hypothetical protein